jgi:hypothetical protein
MIGEQMSATGFIYIWHDKTRKMFYIGCHYGSEDDGYICSSRRMMSAYHRRPNDFTRRILVRDIPSREALLEEEYNWLQLIPKTELGKRYYNLSNRHYGHWSTSESKRETMREKLRRISKTMHTNPEYQKKYNDGLATRKNWQTEEHIEKRASANRGKKRTEEQILRLWNAIPKGCDHPNYGKSLSEETKSKISNAVRGEKNPFFGKKHSEETKQKCGKKISKALEGKVPKNLKMFVGSFWWNNGHINKRSHECPGIDWVKGRLPLSPRSKIEVSL